MVGLSPALGTFLAGVVLADSEYRHELESDIEPFKGLLLGLFFISVGASIDFGLLARDPLLIAGLVLALITVKIAVLFGLSAPVPLCTGGQPAVCVRALAGRRVRVRADRLRGSERGISADFVANPLAAAVAVSMLTTPLLLILYERLLCAALRAPARGARGRRDPGGRPRHHRRLRPLRSDLGRDCSGRTASTSPCSTTAPTRSSCCAASATRSISATPRASTCCIRPARAQAKVLIIAIDDPEKTLEIVEIANKHFPNLKIIARAYDRRRFTSCSSTKSM